MTEKESEKARKRVREKKDERICERKGGRGKRIARDNRVRE